MRIENHQQSFCAKLKLSGCTHDISKEMQGWLMKKAETVGTENDLILIHIGQPEKKSLEKSFLGIPYKKYLMNRTIYSSATINRQMTDMDMSYSNVEISKFNENEYIKNSVGNFFGLLKGIKLK